MKTNLSILVFILIPGLLFCQPGDSTRAKTGTFIGFRSGLDLSLYKVTGDEWFGHYYTVTINQKDLSPAIGFNAGIFLDFKRKKRFSLQPELNIFFSRHRIIYSTWQRQGTAGIVHDYNYYLSSVVLQLSIPAKMRFRTIPDLNIFAGPYCNFPVYVSRAEAKSEIAGDKVLITPGTLIALRYDFPLKSDMIGLEIRWNAALFGTISTPRTIRENNILFAFSYQFLRAHKPDS